MNVLRFVLILFSLSAISCRPSANPTTQTQQSEGNSNSKQASISVTIDGRPVTPREIETFGELAKERLSVALHKALNDQFQKLLQKLEVEDPIETDLTCKSFGFTTSNGAELLLLSVYLIRPDKEVKEPHAIVLSHDGQPRIRFTRATAPVERALAIVSLTCREEGRLKQTETFLVLKDGKWQPRAPIEQNKSL